MGIDEIAIDCVHKIRWGTLAGSRRDSGYSWHDAALPEGMMRENKEIRLCSWSCNKSRTTWYYLLRLGFALIVTRPCHANLGPPRLDNNLPGNSAGLLRKWIDTKRRWSYDDMLCFLSNLYLDTTDQLTKLSAKLQSPQARKKYRIMRSSAMAYGSQSMCPASSKNMRLSTCPRVGGGDRSR